MPARLGEPAKNRIDLTGHRYGRLLVLGYVETRGKRPVWECQCDCGTVVNCVGGNLKNGSSSSCGCFRREMATTRNHRHGLRYHRFYLRWNDMMHRCYNPKNEFYGDYGGRGIDVCPKWQDVANFIVWCEGQVFEEGMTLDRHPDNDGPYSPDNCRFATPAQQNRNMRSNIWVEYRGERLVFKDFVSRYGVVEYSVARKRHRNLGWDAINAALTPVGLERVR